jgi:hypothetical protein
MILSLAVLSVAAAVDGQMVLRHTSALNALGPHPFGSPRTRAAAEYVAAQLRDVGLGEVRLQEFQSSGRQGANVIGVLRASGPEFMVIATHHDTAPDSPGAHEASSGPALLIELARVFSRGASRPRSLVFASFDGGHAAAGRGAGASTYLATLGPQTEDVVAVVSLGGFGRMGGVPVVQTPGHARSGKGPYAITPAWVARAAFEGAARSEEPLAIGDPGFFSWLYQPAVRTFRLAESGGEAAVFAAAGLATLHIDDTPARDPYAWRDRPTDTPEKLDIEALARGGQSVAGALRVIVETPRGPAHEPAWFAAFGRVLGPGVLMGLGALSLVPPLVTAFRSGGVALAARVAQAVLFLVLLWRHPVPALAVLALPNLAAAVGSRAVSALALSAAAALGITGFIGWRRGIVVGTWLEGWEMALFAVALAASLVPSRPVYAKGRAGSPLPRGKGLPRGPKRRSRGRS